VPRFVADYQAVSGGFEAEVCGVGVGDDGYGVAGGDEDGGDGSGRG